MKTNNAQFTLPNSLTKWLHLRNEKKKSNHYHHNLDRRLFIAQTLHIKYNVLFVTIISVGVGDDACQCGAVREPDVSQSIYGEPVSPHQSTIENGFADCESSHIVHNNIRHTTRLSPSRYCANLLLA